MLTALAMPVALLAVFSSTLALALLVRPRALLGVLAWLDDGGAALREGRLDAEGEARVLAMAGRLRGPALAGVFAISFAAGALLALAGLDRAAPVPRKSVDVSAPNP